MPAKTRGSRRKLPPGDRRGGPSAKRLAGNPFAALVTTVRREVDARLGGLLDAKVDAARALGPEVEEMVAAFRDLCLRGGKRLRAALVVAGYRIAAPGADLEPALDAAVAVELLHAYFLVHDDWMDGDPTRRGGPSVHALLSSRLGSPTLGASSAVLAGDLGVALAQEALARVDVPPSRLPRVFAAFAEMQADAIAGQQRDVVARGGDVELTYRLKTGSYTAAGPLRLGALLGGGRERLIGGLERVAVPAGVAFQLRDDLLSLFADPAETGKPFASDLRAGKRTALIAAVERLASPADRAAVRRVLGKPRATDAALRAATRAIERSGARAAVEARLEALAGEAHAALGSLRIGGDSAELLAGAVRLLVDRRS